MLEIEISGVAVQIIHQSSKKWYCFYEKYFYEEKHFYEELLSKNNFETVLSTFCCYDHAAKASEAVQKIATDQKTIANAPRVLLFPQEPKYTYQWITNCGKRLFHRTPLMKPKIGAEVS